MTNLRSTPGNARMRKLAFMVACTLCLLIMMPSVAFSKLKITAKLSYEPPETVDLVITITFEKADKTQAGIRVPDEWTPADTLRIGKSGEFPGLVYSSSLSAELNASHPVSGQTWWAYEDTARTLDTVEVLDVVKLWTDMDMSASGGVYPTTVGVAVGDDLYGWSDIHENVQFPPWPVPSLTNWGMLALLVLLVLSAVFVIRQRRRGSVPA